MPFQQDSLVLTAAGTAGTTDARIIFQYLQKFSRAHWLILTVNKRTDTSIYNLCDVEATGDSEQADNFLLSKTNWRQFFMCLCCFFISNGSRAEWS